MRKSYVRIANDGAPAREERLHGRPFVVRPVAMLVEGVHSGSGGPLLYRAAALETDPWRWNGYTVTVRHPEVDGAPVSANSPRVEDAQGVGRLYNTWFDASTKKLRSEIWADREVMAERFPALLERFLSSSQIEVSTGIYTEEKPLAGVWNGEQYDGEVIDYLPDHLAILDEEIGACSWRDGCGVRDNAEGERMKRSSRWAMNAEAQNAAPAQGTEAAGAGLSGLKAQVLAAAAQSHEELRRKLQRCVDAYDADGWLHFVVEVYDDSVIFEAWGSDPATGQSRAAKTFRQSYSVDESGSCALAGQPQEVRELRQWVPVGNEAGEPSAEPGDPGAATAAAGAGDIHPPEGGTVKNELVRKIAAAPGPFQNQAALLETMTECQLGVLAATLAADPPPQGSPNPKEAPAPAPAASTTPAASVSANAEPPTLAAYMASAPAEVQAIVNAHLAREKEAREQSVAAIKANAMNRFTDPELAAMPTEALDKLAAMAKPSPSFQFAADPSLRVTNGAAPDLQPLIPATK